MGRASPAATLRCWVDYTAEVSRQPAKSFPTPALLELLHETFGTPVEWNRLHDGRQDWIFLHAPPGWPSPGSLEYALDHMPDHPLVRWFERTGSPAPMTLGRVPETVADRSLVSVAREVIGPDMSEHLAIPAVMSRSGHGVLAVHRGDRDFTDQELALAHQLQPLLMLLERQATMATTLSLALDRDFALTSRESAVLGLLRQDLTVPAIGAHLACSPRTVEKHLEHLYRKLGVRNRLGAIRLAEAHDAARAEHAHELPSTGTGTGTQPPRVDGTLVLAGRLSRVPEYPGMPVRQQH